MSGRIVRRRIVRDGVVTRTWTPLTGWLTPEEQRAGRDLAEIRARAARFLPIPVDEETDPNPWGAPSGSDFARGTIGRPGPRNARFV